MKRWSLVTSLATVVACAQAPSPAPASAPTAPVVAGSPPGPRAPAAPAELTAPVARAPAEPRTLHLTPIDQPTYDLAKARAREGRLREAKRLLARLVVAYPSESVLVDEYNDAERRLTAAEAQTKASLEAKKLVVLDPPPFVYTLARPAAVPNAPIPKLHLAKQRKNGITDTEDWYVRENVRRAEHYVPPRNDFFFLRGEVTLADVRTFFASYVYVDYRAPASALPDELPHWVPIAYGTLPIAHAIVSGKTLLAIYGDRVLAAFDAGERKARALYDFGNYMHPTRNVRTAVKVGEATLVTPDATKRYDVQRDVDSITHELRFAQATDHTLFVAHTNRNYAKDNKGQNAYVTALDIDTGAIAWRSAPLVANAESFALSEGGSAVVCGYGFTAEPDFLYVLDAATGAVRQKLPVPSGPEEIIAKDGRFFVRTYDADLVFDTR